MANLLKRNGKLAIEKEAVEGVYQGSPAASSFIKATAEGVTLGKTKEELTEDLLGTGNGMSAHKQGLTTSTGSVAMPLATSKVAGAIGPMSASLESLLGVQRVLAETVCTATTTTVLTIPAHTYVKGDLLLIKEAGAFELRPVASVAGDDVTLGWALSSDPSNTVAVSAVVMHSPADTGHPSLSLTQYFGNDADAMCEQVIGAKCISMSFDNYVTGQLADVSFSYEGLDYKRINSAPATPVYGQAERSAIKSAYVFQNGAVFKINEFGLSVQNTVAAISNTKDGKTALIVTKREVTGTINPYMTDGAAGLVQYNKFDQALPFSLLVYHSNPTAVAGENANWTAVYMPSCKIKTIETGDYNGVLTDNLAFGAYVTDDSQDIYIGQI